MIDLTTSIDDKIKYIVENTAIEQNDIENMVILFLDHVKEAGFEGRSEGAFAHHSLDGIGTAVFCYQEESIWFTVYNTGKRIIFRTKLAAITDSSFTRLLEWVHMKKRKKETTHMVDIIKEIHKKFRCKKLIDKLKVTTTPVEAFDLIAEFLGDDTEVEGSLTRKGVKIGYHLKFSAHDKELVINIEVKDKQAGDNSYPIFTLNSCVKRESIHRVYGSIKSLVEMFQ